MKKMNKTFSIKEKSKKVKKIKKKYFDEQPLHFFWRANHFQKKKKKKKNQKNQKNQI